MNVGRNDTLMETTMLVNSSINSPHVKINNVSRLVRFEISTSRD